MEHHDEYTPAPRCQNTTCRRPFLPEREGQTYCSARCREAGKKRRQRFRAKYGSDPEELLASPDATGDTMPRTRPGDPYDDDGQDDEHGLVAGDADDDVPSWWSRLQQHAEARRPPSRIRRDWRAWGRRHGTEHPQQASDRAGRQQAEADDIRARIDGRYPYRVEDQYDRRTIGNTARRGQESRTLNARYQDYGVLPSQEFDFNETVRNANLYQRGAGTSGRARHSDYAWNMRDGW
jgi:hypothetical protein